VRHDTSETAKGVEPQRNAIFLARAGLPAHPTAGIRLW